jgi:hypothetical protein
MIKHVEMVWLEIIEVYKTSRYHQISGLDSAAFTLIIVAIDSILELVLLKVTDMNPLVLYLAEI